MAVFNYRETGQPKFQYKRTNIPESQAVASSAAQRQAGKEKRKTMDYKRKQPFNLDEKEYVQLKKQHDQQFKMSTKGQNLLEAGKTEQYEIEKQNSWNQKLKDYASSFNKRLGKKGSGGGGGDDIDEIINNPEYQDDPEEGGAQQGTNATSEQKTGQGSGKGKNATQQGNTGRQGRSQPEPQKDYAVQPSGAREGMEEGVKATGRSLNFAYDQTYGALNKAGNAMLTPVRKAPEAAANLTDSTQEWASGWYDNPQGQQGQQASNATQGQQEGQAGQEFSQIGQGLQSAIQGDGEKGVNQVRQAMNQMDMVLPGDGDADESLNRIVDQMGEDADFDMSQASPEKLAQQFISTAQQLKQKDEQQTGEDEKQAQQEQVDAAKERAVDRRFRGQGGTHQPIQNQSPVRQPIQLQDFNS